MRCDLRQFATRAASAALVVSSGIAWGQPIGQPEAATGRYVQRTATARHHMVVAANGHAVDAALEVLRAGGSALDAAVAAQLVLGLVEPQSSGIGGGGFLLHWSQRERRLRSYDGRETAPLASRSDRFIDENHRPESFYDAVTSGRSVGVPGVLRMLETAHRRHGRLPWRRLFGPAIRLAEQGFEVSPRLHQLVARDRFLAGSPDARAIYYRADGTPRAIGERLRNPGYARTLRSVARGGADAFYFGAIAEDVVRAVRSHARAGDLTLVDLARYRAIERDPVCGRYRVWRVCGMGPPSAGGIVVLQMLGILERVGYSEVPANSALAVHLFAEAGRLAYADRARFIADPAFVAQPVAGLLSSAYLDARARLVGERSMRAAEHGVPAGASVLGDGAEHPEGGTTHLSIVDREGNAVALTSSVENAFGSRIMVRGFLLNNQLTDFAFDARERGGPAANRVEPGKRPRSTMAPTMVFDAQGRLVLLLGSPGGRGIANFVVKVLVANLDWGVDLPSAVALPNFGSTNGPTVIERGTLYEDHLAEALDARGHVLNFSEMTSGVHAIRRDRRGRLLGAADPRREGTARGD